MLIILHKKLSIPLLNITLLKYSICRISGCVYATLLMSSNEKSHSCLYICEIKRNVYTILYTYKLKFLSLSYTLVHIVKYGIT